MAVLTVYINTLSLSTYPGQSKEIDETENNFISYSPPPFLFDPVFPTSSYRFVTKVRCNEIPDANDLDQLNQELPAGEVDD